MREEVDYRNDPVSKMGICEKKATFLCLSEHIKAGIYILAIFPPSGKGEIFCSNRKTGKNLKEERKGKGGKRKKKE